MNILFVDFETSGVSAQIDYPITGSFSIVDYDSLNTLDEFDLQFKPILYDIDLPYWRFKTRQQRERYVDSEKMHKIPLREASRFPKQADSFRELQQKLSDKDYILCCHSMFTSDYFDASFLKALYINHCDDLLFSYRRTFKGVMSTFTFAKYLYSHGMINPDGFSLDKLCKYFKIDLNHHDAKDDKRACESLFKQFRTREPKGYDKYSATTDREFREHARRAVQLGSANQVRSF